MPSIGIPETSKSALVDQVKISPNNKAIDREVLEKLNPKPTSNKKTDPSKLDKDDFLKMLGAQMKNQDPSQPADQEKFTNTMAQFAQLEQLTQLNKHFSQSAGDNREQLVLKASSLVGKKIIVNQQTLSLENEGEEKKIYFSLEKPMKQGKVSVVDAAGYTVAIIPLESLGRGEQHVSWNGRVTDGQKAPKGSYKIQVQGLDETGSALQGATKVSGTVETASIEGKEIVLNVAGKKINLRDIEQIGQ